MKIRAASIVTLTVVGFSLGYIATEPKPQATPYPTSIMASPDTDRSLSEASDGPARVSIR
jgi:hypothetical protein